MAKRINYAKTIFLHYEVLKILENKFRTDIEMNTFSNKYVYISESCKNQNIPYKLGELNGICVNAWREEAQMTNFFIISQVDVDGLIKGKVSKEFEFIEKLYNNSQSIVDQNKFKITRSLPIISEECFFEYYNNRQGFIAENKGRYKYNNFLLYDLMTRDYCVLSEKPQIKNTFSFESIDKSEIKFFENLESKYSQEEMIKFKEKQIPKEWLTPKELTAFPNKFTGKKVVITGDFSFKRNHLAKLLWESGADLDTTITSKTDFVIKGENAGWKKCEQIEQMGIECISEDEIKAEYSEL